MEMSRDSMLELDEGWESSGIEHQFEDPYV
jgi:hypothetical protein